MIWRRYLLGSAQSTVVPVGGREVSAAPWQMVKPLLIRIGNQKEGHYRVRLDNKWVDVPDEAVITEPNRAGRTMVWPMRFDEQISIGCFMPGSMN